MNTNTEEIVKEFHGVRLLRNTKTMESRIIPIPMPQPQTPEPVYSPEAIAATEKAVALYKLMQESKVTTSYRVIEPEKKPMTFEDELEHDWRHSPALRKEFTSFGSYQAFMRAQKAGRCKVYGCGQGTSTR